MIIALKCCFFCLIRKKNYFDHTKIVRGESGSREAIKINDATTCHFPLLYICTDSEVSNHHESSL